MIDVENVRVFVKVAELSNFTRAAEQLNMPKSRISLRVKALESEIGSQLFRRTTRAVHLTEEGEQFLDRARRIVGEVEELGSMFQSTSAISGRVRLDLPVAFARNFVIPRLPELLAQHPRLDLVVSSTDRRVDVIGEGFDVVLRIGTLRDSGLVAKRIGAMPMANYASPSYLRKYGTPRSIADLDRHLLVHYSLTLGGDEPTFEYRKGNRWAQHPMKSLITVNSTDAYAAACAAGLGIIQAPRDMKDDQIRRGALVEVLPAHTCEPLHVSLVHAHTRDVPKRVRIVLSFLEDVLREPLSSS